MANPTEAQRVQRAAAQRRFRERHPERRRAIDRAYYARNRERILSKISAYNKAHPGHSRSLHLKQKYGLSIEQYDAMLLAQQGGCAICHTADPGDRTGRFNVDHRKGSRVVRGLLCRDHNLALGLFKDNPEHLRAAAEYLEIRNGQSA